jgi:aspartyl-tRNA synthetase
MVAATSATSRSRAVRDEDVRADRQPEFTQLDVEMSFVSVDDVLDLMEELYTALCETIRPEMKVTRPFARLTYEEAMRRFGTDKPDLRYGMELADLTDLVAASEFAIFRQAVEAAARWGFAVLGASRLCPQAIEDLTSFVQAWRRGLSRQACWGRARGRSPTRKSARHGRFLNAEVVKAMASAPAPTAATSS